MYVEIDMVQGEVAKIVYIWSVFQPGPLSNREESLQCVNTFILERDFERDCKKFKYEIKHLTIKRDV